MVQILYDSKVTLLSVPTFTEPAHLPVEWAGEASDGERLMEYAGRMCYMSQANPANRTTADYLTNIMRQGHGSVLEHGDYVMLIEGIDRACSHELVRHRAGWGYSQLSQRYVDESDTAFVLPPALEGDLAAIQLWEEQCARALDSYTVLTAILMDRYHHIEDRTHRRKMAREAARSILPNATETKVVASANLRAWRTMLELRTGEGADRQIRRMALHCLDTLRTVVPSVFADFENYIGADGTPAARVTYHKV